VKKLEAGERPPADLFEVATWWMVKTKQAAARKRKATKEKKWTYTTEQAIKRRERDRNRHRSPAQKDRKKLKDALRYQGLQDQQRRAEHLKQTLDNLANAKADAEYWHGGARLHDLTVHGVRIRRCGECHALFIPQEVADQWFMAFNNSLEEVVKTFDCSMVIIHGGYSGPCYSEEEKEETEQNVQTVSISEEEKEETEQNVQTVSMITQLRDPSEEEAKEETKTEQNVQTVSMMITQLGGDPGQLGEPKMYSWFDIGVRHRTTIEQFITQYLSPKSAILSWLPLPSKRLRKFEDWLCSVTAVLYHTPHSNVHTDTSYWVKHADNFAPRHTHAVGWLARGRKRIRAQPPSMHDCVSTRALQMTGTTANDQQRKYMQTCMAKKPPEPFQGNLHSFPPFSPQDFQQCFFTCSHMLHPGTVYIIPAGECAKTTHIHTHTHKHITVCPLLRAKVPYMQSTTWMKQS
jgi:hypothetical protein